MYGSGTNKCTLTPRFQDKMFYEFSNKIKFVRKKFLKAILSNKLLILNLCSFVSVSDL